jgi:CMP-N-acetylneuraminic acid synthetase
MKKVAYTPIKLNNERMPGKNTKAFDNGYPLIQYVLRTLDDCIAERVIDEAYCFCSNPEIQRYFPQETRVEFLLRDESLDNANATSNDIIKRFCKQVPADVYVLIHATCPFTSKAAIKRAVSLIESGVSDSAIACKKTQSFLFDENGKALNFNVLKIPRTQDLTALFEPTTGLWAFNRGLAEIGRTIGDKPALFEVAPIETIDIDYEDDFIMANIIWNGLRTLNVPTVSYKMGGGDECLLTSARVADGARLTAGGFGWDDGARLASEGLCA